MSSHEFVELAALVPGERYVKKDVPHVVYTKMSHAHSRLVWKQHTATVYPHPSTLVRRASAEELNPGESTEKQK